jgi:signal transduction histidine kinase/DNA-binding CsgD family transcriptional regulator
MRNGAPVLTLRQRELAVLLASGRSNRQIATELGLSPGTVANYVRRLLGTLGLRSRAQVAAWAVEHGMTGAHDRLLTLLEQLMAIQTPDLEAALAAAADLVVDAFGADKADAFLLDPTAETLVAVGASHTPLARKQRAIGMNRLPLANGGRTVEVFQTRTPRLDGHVEEDPGELAGVKDGLGVRSAMATPLEVGGHVRGVLSVVSQTPDLFTGRDLRLLESVTRWVGLIAHRAELVGQLTESATLRGRREGAEELLAVLAHDMRNHLTPMQGRIDLLRMAARRDRREGDVRQMNQLEANVSRLQRLLADLLDTSRLEHGLFALNVRAVDLVALVRATLTDLEQLDATVELQAPDELWLSEADPDRLRQAIENLLTNAIQHAAPATSVILEIDTQQRDACQWAVLSVTNVGPPIPGELLPRLFERFAPGPGSRGLGLGLYIARGIACAHGGTLEASSATGVGTTFRLSLPLRP